MNKNKLKTYAPQARRDFREAVSVRAVVLGLSPDSTVSVEVSGDVAIINGQPYPRNVAVLRERLVERIEQEGWDQFVEEIAYTWFNRFTALRFMELNGFLPHGLRVLSNPDESKDEPEILEKAHTVELPGLVRERVVELKLAANKEAELYRLLLVAQCNQLHAAMPFLFERINDETELLLPDNLLHSDSVIRKLVSQINEENWQQVEIIGWLYQFYISDRKEEVIGSVVKSEDIPAATQLFTPNWIVKYITQNSLGRLWLQTYPHSDLRLKMEYYIDPAEQSEEVKRELANLTPASINPEEIKILDPACGSGHILVEAYNLLKEIYRERGYSSRDIPRIILEKNLYGLDIDERAAQLASFSLLMRARTDERRVLEEKVPRLNILAIPESSHLNARNLASALLTGREPRRAVPIRDETSLFADVQAQQSLAVAIEVETETHTESEEVTRDEVVQVLGLFEQGKTLGSLIEIPAQMLPTIAALQRVVAAKITSPELMERTAAQQLAPFVHVAITLSQQYDCVLANPPYMGNKYYNPDLKKQISVQYPDGKGDLYGCFVERNTKLCKPNGYVGMITWQNWMFLPTFDTLRERLLENQTITSLVHNGRGVFGSDFGSCSFILLNTSLPIYKGTFRRLFEKHGSVSTVEELELRFFKVKSLFATTKDFKKIPSYPIAYWASEKMRRIFESNRLLGEIAEPRQGMATSDNGRFLRYWFEVDNSKIGTHVNSRQQARESGLKWFPYSKGGEFRRWFGNNEYVVNWENDGAEVIEYAARLYGSPTRTIKNIPYYFKPAITWSLTSMLGFGARIRPCGFIFDVNGMSMFLDEERSGTILGLLNSKLSSAFLSIINPTIAFQAGDIARLPVLPFKEYKKEIAPKVYEAIRIATDDWNNFETSWDFQTSPLLRADLKTSNVAESYANWERECCANIRLMQELETDNNRLFIETYGLQAELSPEVTKEQITLARAEASTDLPLLVSYAVGCMMGRYSLDEPGLIYAQSGGIGFDPSRYRTFTPDEDGIIPLTDLEWFDDDAANRFTEFVRHAWGDDTYAQNLGWIAAQLGAKSGEIPVETIRRYFSAQFFKDHLPTYKKRPIYWLFSSGKQRAFECLVYLHRYNESTLSRIRTEYVTPLFGKLAGRIEYLGGTDGQGGLIASSTSTAEKNRLRKQLEALKKKQTELIAFDDELRHYADMRIKLDLDDGVKINYGKFGHLLAEVRSVTGGSAE